MIPGIIDYIFGVMWITKLTLQIGNLGNIVIMSCLGQIDLRSLGVLVLLCYSN